MTMIVGRNGTVSEPVVLQTQVAWATIDEERACNGPVKALQRTPVAAASWIEVVRLPAAERCATADEAIVIAVDSAGIFVEQAPLASDWNVMDVDKAAAAEQVPLDAAAI